VTISPSVLERRDVVDERATSFEVEAIAAVSSSRSEPLDDGWEGRVLRVSGLDAINGTPVLDVKPYLQEFGPRGEVRQPDWSHELMRTYW
jgi:tRNA (L-threonylcarbamoyladenosine(37)-C2) methyltransferase TrmO-like protein